MLVGQMFELETTKFENNTFQFERGHVKWSYQMAPRAGFLEEVHTDWHVDGKFRHSVLGPLLAIVLFY